MQPLFMNDNKYAYLLIATLLLSSLYFAASPTGMAAGAKRNLVDVAFNSETVRSFAASNPDFSVMTEELVAEKLAALQEDFPDIYSGIPGMNSRLYQMIFDAKDKAMIVLLTEDAVFGVREVQLPTMS